MSPLESGVNMPRNLPRDDDGRLSAWAWPGGYPIYYLSDDGQVFCPDCANQEDAEPEITAADINYEDPALICEGCGVQIESAYAEDDSE
jgi:hypothetical protein